MSFKTFSTLESDLKFASAALVASFLAFTWGIGHVANKFTLLGISRSRTALS